MLAILQTVQDLDLQAVRWLTFQVSQNQWLTALTYICAHLLILVPAFAPLLLWWIPAQRKRLGMRRAIVLCGLTVASSLALKAGIDFVFQRARPFEADPNLLHMMIPAAGNSFPSGHTIIAMAIAVGFLVGGRKVLGWWLVACAVLIALGRVAAGVHYPSDVLASLIFASVIGLMLRHEASGLKHYLPAE